MFVCVSGVSGSGKSTLVTDILSKKAAQLLYNARDRPGEVDAIIGLELLDKVVVIDQSPIGRTPRSNPATYTGTFTPIRELFASVPEARLRGYRPGRFSFNVKGGRCEACQGEGYIQIEMQFLPDVEVPCEVCHGARYNREALEILFRGKNIAEVLDMTVEQAVEFFEAFPRVRTKLQTLHDVGLGYIRIGQPATTLSGGEAQRVKLATELSRRATGRTLYILDEPTTGLSFEDVNALMGVLHRLVDTGNTVLVIEHHLDVIKQADHIIDLGPLGGDRGGEIVAEGTPEEVAEVEDQHHGTVPAQCARAAAAAGGEVRDSGRRSRRRVRDPLRPPPSPAPGSPPRPRRLVPPLPPGLRARSRTRSPITRTACAKLQPVIDAQLDDEAATLELNPLQATLLSTALSSVVSELKMYSVFDTMSGASRRPRSTAPGFDDRLRSLFPEIAGDPAYASQLAEDMTMLRRELPLGAGAGDDRRGARGGGSGTPAQEVVAGLAALISLDWTYVRRYIGYGILG